MKEIPVPTDLGPHDILIKVAVASFCHTDLMVLEGDMTAKPTNLSGSHEPSGIVVKTGSSVAGFATGDRIAALGAKDLCGKCDDCIMGEDAKGLNYAHYCDTHTFTGISCPGAFQEYTVVDSRSAVKIPDKLSFISAAPLTCAGATAWRALKVSDANTGDWVAVIGSGGGLGHLAVRFAVAKGLKVVGIEARDEGLTLTKKSGAHVVVDARIGTEDMVKQVHEAIGAKGVAASIVFSDHTTATATACYVTRKHGTVVVVSQPPEFVIPFKQLIFRDLRIRGSLLATGVDFDELVKFVAAHDITVEASVFHGLQSLPKVIETSIAGKTAGKLVVVVDEALK